MRAIKIALSSASILAFASIAGAAYAAQPAPEAGATSSADDNQLGEIVVTARRRSESLQEVPQVVNAVTADTLQKLNIRDFRDVQTVVPGLALETISQGYANSASLRGVTFDVLTSAPPTVALYLNDAPVQAGVLFTTMFDVGQVEVLRGPQGTTRGVSAPSGAITMTTRRPNLSEYGGYIDVTATDQHRRNINGAVNVPIIKDVLGLRVAAAFDQNAVDNVNSIYSNIKPRGTSSAVRTSLSFEPNDDFNANLSYVHIEKVTENYVQVQGPGRPANPFAPFAGSTPPISAKDMVAVSDAPTENRFHFDVVTAQVDSRVFGQHLTYVGSYSHQKFRTSNDRDTGQQLIGVPINFKVLALDEQTTHEIRLSSDPTPGRFLDYTVGAYYNWEKIGGLAEQVANYLPGAFGPLAAPNLALFNPQFQLPLLIPTPRANQETSLFGTLTAHLGPKTELSAGIRQMWSITTNDTQINLGNGLLSTAAIAGAPVPCAFIQPFFPIPLVQTPQAGVCSVPLGGTVVTRAPVRRTSETPTIYNVSLSHRFNRDLMVYGNTGTSYRAPFGSTGIFNASNDPTLNSLISHPSEKSRAYEIGFKWTFMEGRGRLNAALFRQKFRDLSLYVPNVPYVSNNGQTISVIPFDFTASTDALVEGFDFDAAFQITPEWNVGLQASYSDGRVSGGGAIPCNDSNFDGVPDGGAATLAQFQAAGKSVATCGGNISVSRLPYWNASLQSEYIHAFNDDVDGFIRGLLTYYPENSRASPGFTVDNYGLLNLYAGVRSHDGAWEVSLFTRNALNTQKIVSLSPAQLNQINTTLGGYQALALTVSNPGYFEAHTTAPREVGVSVRYAFGSR